MHAPGCPTFRSPEQECTCGHRRSIPAPPPPEGARETPEELLTEARNTIRRLNRRAQLAEAAVEQKVETFEQRGNRALRGVYLNKGRELERWMIAKGYSARPSKTTDDAPSLEELRRAVAACEQIAARETKGAPDGSTDGVFGDCAARHRADSGGNHRDDDSAVAGARARLEALAESWKKRAQLAGQFCERHPSAARDLKDSVAGQAYMLDECAHELDRELQIVRALLSPGDAPTEKGPR